MKEFFGQTDSAMHGLSDSQVEDRIKKDGYNEIAKQKKRSIFDIVIEVLKEPMFLMLIACALLYFLFGELSDALMLSFSACIVIGITIYQERKVERAIEALRDLSSPRALVIRNGEQKMIPGREVVLDDIIILSEGDRVPADAVLISSSNLLVDESLLTGESIPVRKIEWDGKIKHTQIGGDNSPFVYSSTLIVGGHAIAKVTAVGSLTEVGKIGRAIEKIEPEQTVLQKETEKIVKIFSILGFIVCSLIIIFYSISKNNIVEGLLAGLSAAMSMLPEEFPVVLTVFLALGAWRMSKSSVLTRRLNAIQNMGSATVLCTDKTGTLTLNKMTVQKLSLFDGKETGLKGKGLKSEFHEILEYGILASQKNPFDPMEKAIIHAGHEKLKDTHHLHNWELLKEYPLSKEILAVSNVWRTSDQKKIVIASKGAPESIISLCHMSHAQKEKLLFQVKKLSREGLRVIGV
jgi:Ca2+-transporting ATPase